MMIYYLPVRRELRRPPKPPSQEISRHGGRRGEVLELLKSISRMEEQSVAELLPTMHKALG